MQSLAHDAAQGAPAIFAPLCSLGFSRFPSFFDALHPIGLLLFVQGS